MNVSGTNSIHVADTQVTGQPAEFRLNQRITADILKVSGDQVTLVIQGQQVVGRVAGGDQSTLEADKQAQFLVKGMIDGILQLQLIPTETGQSVTSTLANQWTILAQNLLNLNGLEINDQTLMLGKALLSAGLPVNSELINQMQSVLSGIKNWGQTEADLSASLISNGLPLSSGSISLTLQNLPSLMASFEKLQSQLENLLTTNSSFDTRSLAQQALNILRGTLIDFGDSPANLISQIRNSIAILGKSLESHLADALKNNNQLANAGQDSSGLLTLAYLQRQLTSEGRMGVAQDIDRFMDSLRQMQFLNSAVPKDPTNPPWLVVNLPLTVKNPQNQTDLQNANIKISYRADEEGKEIDAGNNRIIFTIPLDEDNSLEVDLSMVQKKVGAWLTAPDEDWKGIIDEELPSLKAGIEAIGYQMQFIRCETKLPTSVIDLSSVHRVNLEA